MSQLLSRFTRLFARGATGSAPAADPMMDRLGRIVRAERARDARAVARWAASAQS